MDFAAALKKVKRTGETAQHFHLSDGGNTGSVARQGLNDLAKQMKMLQTLLSGTNDKIRALASIYRPLAN